LQRLTRLKEEVGQWEALDARIADLAELLQMAEGDDGEALRGDLEAEIVTVRAALEKLEFGLLLGDRYDDRDAFLTIKAGMGGTDAQDWAAMMLRMYTRWAEAKGYTVSLVDQSEGDEAGIKSATLEMRGPYAYGYIKAEGGVHRLIRLSPFNSAHTRQTSFARVEVMPEVDDAAEVSIRPDDLRIDVYRAGGHGGQGVNTTDSAVRLVYKGGTPEEIVVTCQNERSQIQNKETAMRVLRGKLLERELERQREERARLRGAIRANDFGSQMRTYYLHPSTLVKDHRTDAETSNVQAVLNGDLDEFIGAYLRWNVGNEG
jgi:peptide chain release factor 2